MAKKRFEDLRRKTFSPEKIREQEAWVERELLELELAEIRKALGKTQVELAAALEMSQGQVSTTETRSDHLVSTLRRYVEALGGTLELVANFPGKAGDKRVRLLAARTGKSE